MCSSFCSISPCPVAATHMSLSNYLGQRHQIIPTEIILKGTESGGWRCLGSAGGQNVDKCIMNAERTEARKMVAASRAKAGLITLGDPNCIKCAISDAAQAERSGLSVIILSAQLTGSSCNANRSRQNTNADMRWQWPHLGLYWQCAIVKCLDLEPGLLPMLLHPAVTVPPAPRGYLHEAVTSTMRTLPCVERVFTMPFSKVSNTRSSENSGKISRSSTGMSNWDQ